MSRSLAAKALLDIAEDGLREAGYDNTLLHRHYVFADILKNRNEVQQIDLAAHAQEPPDYFNACFGITISDINGSEAIERYRSLGAPQIFALHPLSGLVNRWGMVASGKPKLLETIKLSHLRNTFIDNRERWHPLQILRSKSGRSVPSSAQLDFFDNGLVPVIESEVHKKLDSLLQSVDEESKASYREYTASSLEGERVKELYRLIFRLVAAKLLADRDYPGDWSNPIASSVIKDVNDFYFSGAPPEALLAVPQVQQRAWDIIRNGCRFQNLSVDALAYIYENTFVTRDTRKRLGTHSTPPQIAQYVLRHLPLESLDPKDRRVFEPFSGAAPFLIAALKQLRIMLPPGTDSRTRHDYFVDMLSGMEIDAFAHEIARYSLILADYPNPAGWHLLNTNAFTSVDFDTLVKRSSVVLCNPPFEDFTLEERFDVVNLRSVNKAAEALNRVLLHPPKMLGFVLPKSFIDAKAFRNARALIASTYSDTSLVALPDIAFMHSESDTVLLLAYGSRAQRARRNCALVTKYDYKDFLRSERPTWEVEALERTAELLPDIGLWHTPLERVWSALETLPTIQDVATIHRGVEYKGPVEQFISDTPKTGFVPGLWRVSPNLEPYLVKSHQFLSSYPEVMRTNAYLLQWHRPKIVANAVRLSRGPWTIAAAIDEQALMCYQNFHGVWQTGNTPLEVIAAVLNGPVANAFITSQRSSRHNQKQLIGRIPIPRLTAEETTHIASLVREYHTLRQAWFSIGDIHDDLESSCQWLAQSIEVAILEAYDLTPGLKRELEDYFEGYDRPGPMSFAVALPLRKGEQSIRADASTNIGYELPEDIYTMYHSLLDRKYTVGLNKQESVELERLRFQLEQADMATPLEQSNTIKSRAEQERRLAVLNNVIAQLKSLKAQP